MNKFLNELAQDIIDEFDFVDGSECDDVVVHRVFERSENTLGENARRMLEIGILQDELMDMDFELQDFNEWAFFTEDSTIRVKFDTFIVKVESDENDYEFDIDNPTWQQDVLTKVKGLINDK